MTQDFTLRPTKWPAIMGLGIAIQSWLPTLPGHRLHPNVTGGLVAMQIPYGLAWLLQLTQSKEQLGAHGHRARMVLATTALALMGFGLLMTLSRGAWLALGIAVGGWTVWKVARRLGLPQWISALLSALVLIGGGIALAALMSRAGLSVVATENQTEEISSLTSRLELVQRASSLVQDYPFTGLGLGRFTMVYSSYVLLIPVGFIVHAHNQLLDLALEQGLIGLAAWLAAVGRIGWDLWRYRGVKAGAAWRTGTGLSLAVMLLHGLVDDTLYGSRGALLLFVPLGMAVLACRYSGPKPQRQPVQIGSYRLRAGLAAPLALIPLAGIALIWQNQLLAAAYANLAAVGQTKAELGVYDHPQHQIQDTVRREVDLSRPMALYQRALSHDPDDGTTNRRIGQIALSLGQYELALEHLTRARAAEPRSPATQQLLGEALITNGRVEEGAKLWDELANDHGQLWARQTWYYRIEDQQRLKWFNQVLEGRE
jgi:tetratricopeptide (TPR) repeat protein